MTEIITDLSKLSQASEPLEFLSAAGINKDEGNVIIDKLMQVFESQPDLITLAAPQIGVNKRIFSIRFADSVKTFINPIIIRKSNYRIAPETCASMPGQEILINRPEELTVVYYNTDYKYEENKLLGGAARLFDQQCQLLDGITPDVLGLVSTVETDGSLADLTEEEIAEIIEFYKNYIQTKQEAVAKQITADADLHKEYQSLSFSEKVIHGEAAIVAEDGSKIKQKAQAKAALATKNLATQDKVQNQAKLKQFLQRKGK